MKSYFVFISILLSLQMQGQSLWAPAETKRPTKQIASGNPLSFEKIFVLDSSLTKDEIYSRSLNWFAKAFVDTKAVFEVQDRVGGQIIGNGIVKHRLSTTMASTVDNIKFVIEVYVKDGKAKMVTKNFDSENFNIITDSPVWKEKGLSAKTYNRLWTELQDAVKARSFDLFQSYQKALNTDTNDW